MIDVRETPHFSNFAVVQNKISPFALESGFTKPKQVGATIDALHGYMWNYQLEPGDAVYGRTEAFPADPLDRLSNGQYVRVPYRRVPRIRVGSVQALREIESSLRTINSSRSVMWRGQTSLHTLRARRSDDEMMKLYGSVDAVEPSLLPSAARANVQVESYMAAWLALMDRFIDEEQDGLLRASGLPAHDELRESAEHLRATYGFRSWAFGVAQHYGLPSTGLDLTGDVDVALFFALHRFSSNAEGKATFDRVASGSNPVILLMSVFDGDLQVDANLAPGHLATPRAVAQDAHFFRTAWGAAPNRAAERILAVLDLEDHARWPLGASGSDLFPSIRIDSYARFLVNAATRFPEHAKIVPLESVYFTV